MTAARDDERRVAATRAARPVIALAILAYAALGIPEGGMGVAFPAIQQTFDLPLSRLGLMLLPLTVGYLTSALFQSRISTLVTLPRRLIICAGIAGAGALALAGAPVFAVLMAGMFLLGLAAGSTDTGLSAYASVHLEPRVLAYIHGGFGLGATLGPLAFTVILTAGLSWRLTFLGLAVVQVGLAIGWFRLRGRFIAARGEAVPMMAFEGDVGELGPTDLGEPAHTLPPPEGTRARVILPLNVACFFFYTGAEASTGLLVATLLVSRGVSESTAGLLTTAYWASLTAGRFITGFVGRRIGPAQALSGAMVGVVIGAALVAAGSGAVTAVGLIVLGFSFAPVFPSLVGLTPHRVGSARTDRAIGFQLAAASIGVTVVPAIISIVADRVGIAVIGPGLLLAALILAVMLVVSGIVAGDLRLPARAWPAGRVG